MRDEREAYSVLNGQRNVMPAREINVEINGVYLSSLTPTYLLTRLHSHALQ